MIIELNDVQAIFLKKMLTYRFRVIADTENYYKRSLTKFREEKKILGEIDKMLQIVSENKIT